MNKLKLVIFDLDGTLLDTSPGIYESIRFATGRLGWPDLTEEQLFSFVGPPLRTSFKRCYDCSDEEADELTGVFRENFRKGSVLNAIPYEGIFDLCAALREHGLVLGVATGKPQPFAEQILSHFGFDRFFDHIHGSDLAGKLTKSDVIRLCMEDAGADADECVLIGDTEHDAHGAHDMGVPFIAVTYGFGHEDLMKQYPNAGVAETTSEVLEIIRRRINAG